MAEGRFEEVEYLKRWNKEVFGRVEIRLAKLMEELRSLEAKNKAWGYQ